MSIHSTINGSTPVGHVSELDALRAASVLYLRLWGESPERRAEISREWVLAVGADVGLHAQEQFDTLCDLCQSYGRRPLMRHNVMCNCLGADEACFANFVATAAEGEREDAMLMATLLVRPDMAPVLADLAAQFGLALKRMGLVDALDPSQTHQGVAGLH